MKLTQAIVFLAGLALCASLDAQGRQLTDVEKSTAYRAVVQQLQTDALGLNNPEPAPIEEVTFTPVWNRAIAVTINVESRNRVGVVIKQQYRFRVWGGPQDPRVDPFNYNVKCLNCSK